MISVITLYYISMKKAYSVIILILSFVALLMSGFVVASENGNKKPTQTKSLSGLTIIGNKEAPKSLYIVPWQDSEVGVETALSSELHDDKNKMIEKQVFERELKFYQLTQKQK